MLPKINVHTNNIHKNKIKDNISSSYENSTEYVGINSSRHSYRNTSRSHRDTNRSNRSNMNDPGITQQTHVQKKVGEFMNIIRQLEQKYDRGVCDKKWGPFHVHRITNLDIDTANNLLINQNSAENDDDDVSHETEWMDMIKQYQLRMQKSEKEYDKCRKELSNERIENQNLREQMKKLEEKVAKLSVNLGNSESQTKNSSLSNSSESINSISSSKSMSKSSILSLKKANCTYIDKLETKNDNHENLLLQLEAFEDMKNSIKQLTMNAQNLPKLYVEKLSNILNMSLPCYLNRKSSVAQDEQQILAMTASLVQVCMNTDSFFVDIHAELSNKTHEMEKLLLEVSNSSLGTKVITDAMNYVQQTDNSVLQLHAQLKTSVDLLQQCASRHGELQIIDKNANNLTKNELLHYTEQLMAEKLNALSRLKAREVELQRLHWRLQMLSSSSDDDLNNENAIGG